MATTQSKKRSTLRKRIATSPKYERTRENNAEFAGAGKAAQLVANAFRLLSNNTSDSKMTARLTRVMKKVVNGDSTSTRGQRNVVNGNILELKDFDFNASGKLATVFFAGHLATIDRATGTLKIDIPAFIPKKAIKAPPNTTHFVLESAAAEIDFALKEHVLASSATANLVYGNQTEAAISLSNVVTPNSTHPLFLALGIRFYQQTNEGFYSLNNGQFNALALIKIDKPAPAPPPAA